MRFEIQAAIENDAEKLFAAIQAMSAEHALAAQTVEGGELFQSEVTERVRTHFKLAQK